MKRGVKVGVGLGVIIIIIVLVVAGAYLYYNSSSRICMAKWEYWTYFPDSNECEASYSYGCVLPLEYTDGYKNEEECLAFNTGCTEDARICPDGSVVVRNSSLGCEFNSCPGFNVDCVFDSDCLIDEICYNSKFCGMHPEEGVLCGPQLGDLKCHKKCQYDSDCTADKENCLEVEFISGDVIGFKQICLMK